ncbi:MAG TPA: DUF2079 domain-containing protein, partial [Caldilineaceae bacterium]|nr:DUF2079 domain-containing protein [Caldilineaceae bacterium]
ALFTQPELVWQQLQSADTGGYLFRLLWPVGFVALLAPEILLLALPSLAINLLADFPPMHEVYTLIYAAPILPFVMLATVEGIGRVVGCYTSATYVGARYLMPRRMRQSNRMRHLLRTVRPQLLVFVALIGAFIAQLQHGYLPGGGNYEHYTVSDHDRRAAAIMAQIPAAAKVSAQDKLDPHVAGRETIYIFPRIDDADTIFVDVTGPAWPVHPSDLHATIEQLLFTDWGVAAGDDGYLLLRKGLPNRTLPPSFYSAFQPPVSAQPPDQPVSIFGEALALLDHQVHVDEHGETVVQLRWKALRHPLTTDYQFYIAFANKDGTIAHDSLFYPPVATLWYPTSMWPVDEQVLVQTLPWQLELDQFTLLVGVYTGEEGWHNGGRIPISNGSTPDRIHLEQNTLVRLGSYRWVQEQWHPIPRRTTIENLAQQRVVHFTDGKAQIQLENVLIESVPEHAGDGLTFALEWWAGREPIPLDYSVFAHLLNEQGEKVAQLDWQPHDDWGPRPMTTWFKATSIVDAQRLLLPEDLPAGNYRLVIGVYNWQTGERLTASGAGATPDNVAPIAEVSIK